MGVLLWTPLAGGTQPYDTYQSTVAADAPAAQYRFNDAAGSKTLADSAGSYTATNSGITFAGEGPFGGSKSGSFGGEAYASLPSSPLAKASEFAVEAWVNWSGGNSFDQPIFDFGSSALNHMFLTPASALGKLQMLFEIRTTTASAQVTAPELAAHAWEYVAVTETGTGVLTLYVNGAQVGQTTGATISPSSLGTVTNDYLGKSQLPVNPDFNGEMSNVAFYSKALSAERIRAHYYAGDFPVSTALPAISGTPVDESTLTASPGKWSGFGLTYTYQWQRCNTAGRACADIEGATGASYVLAQGDVWTTLRVKVTAANEAGQATATSEPSALIGPSAPRSSSPPTIAGTAKEGETLTATPGGWAGTGPLTYAYQWQRCSGSCEAIAGATSSSYAAASHDVGDTLEVTTTASGWGGSSSATSSATSAVSESPPRTTVEPLILGTARAEQVLTASPGEWTGVHVPSFSYQWELCNSAGVECAPIAGATSSKLSLSEADSGKTVLVVVTATTPAGSGVAASLRTAPIKAATAPPEVVEAPALSGNTLGAGETLTVWHGTWTGKPELQYRYLWESCENETHCAVIKHTVRECNQEPVFRENAEEELEITGYEEVCGEKEVPVETSTLVLPAANAGKKIIALVTVTESSGHGASALASAEEPPPTAVGSTTASRRWDSRAMGSDPSHATWRHGSLAVSLVSGNAAIAFPGPSYPTSTGSLGLSVTWNSAPPQPEPTCQAQYPAKYCTPPPNYSTGPRNGGPLGSGFTLSASEGGERRPMTLIDHSNFPQASRFNGVEVVYGDGSDEDLEAVGANVYARKTSEGEPTDEGVIITKNPRGGNAPSNPMWTLREPDGQIVSFGATNPATGEAQVVSDQNASSSQRRGLVYQYQTYVTGGKSERLLAAVTDASGASLHLTWHVLSPEGCANATLCVTGPDSRTWEYVASGASMRVIENGREVMKLAENAIYNADDLNPGLASPGYNHEHRLAIEYCKGNDPGSCPIGAVEAVTESAVNSGGSATAPKWAFYYGQASVFKTHAGVEAKYLTRIYTPKNKGPRTGGGVTGWTWSDAEGHTLQTKAPDNSSGNKGFEYKYDAHGRLISSETPTGALTTYHYHEDTRYLSSVEGPVGSGGSRPVTQYGYSEGAAGAGTHGLSAEYYANPNFAGTPTHTQTDPTSGTGAAVNFSWSSAGPTALNGRGEDYSVAWSGQFTSVEGTYRFKVHVEGGGVRLLIGEKPVLEDAGARLKGDLVAEVKLKAGEHRVELDYVHRRGPAGVALYWKPPGGSEGLIEASALTPQYGDSANRSTTTPNGEMSYSHYREADSPSPEYTVTSAQTGGVDYITSYRYDSLGRVVEKAMPKANAGRKIEPDGKLSGAPDARYTTRYIYYPLGASADAPQCGDSTPENQGGRLETVSSFGEAPTTTVYNAAGQPLAVTNGAGTHCYTYDAEGHLMSEQVPSDAAASACPQAGATACYTYDPVGNQQSARNATGLLSFTYDEAGRITSSVQRAGSQVLSEAALGYDEDSNLTKETVSAGAMSSSPSYTTVYTYDANDQMDGTKDPVLEKYQSGIGYTGHYLYNEYGNQLVQIGYKANSSAANTFTYFTYDPAESLTGVYNRHGETPITGPPASSVPEDSQKSPVADFTYQRDIGERATQQTLSGGGITSGSESYGYDPDGRLTSVKQAGGLEQGFEYDADSNRTSETQTPAGGKPATTQSLAYNPGASPGVDQLTSVTSAAEAITYGYTPGGETSSRGSDALSWSGDGTLRGGAFAGTPVTYTYDALGRLQQRITTNPSSTIRYVYAGDSGTPFAQTDGNGAITSFTVNGPKGPIKVFHGAPAEEKTPYSYVYYDAHGNRVAEANEAGKRTALTTYDAFGAPTPAPSANTLVQGYVGRWEKLLDTQSNLILMGARPYDPTIGRFLTVDPVEGGSANSYDYVAGDPINHVDPRGECELDRYLYPTFTAHGHFGEFEICKHGRHAGYRRIYVRDWNECIVDFFGAISTCRQIHERYERQRKEQLNETKEWFDIIKCLAKRGDCPQG